jgi:hypothetical protein
MEDTLTHRAIPAEPIQAETARRNEQTPNRYEDLDPITGQRLYCGITDRMKRRPDRMRDWIILIGVETRINAD